MTTIYDAYWRTAGPKAPWGPFDPNASLNFSFDLSDWIASAGPSLALSVCDVIADPLLAVAAAVAGSEVTVRVSAINPSTLPIGAMLPFTLRMTLSDGQRDDRTFYLLVRDR